MSHYTMLFEYDKRSGWSRLSLVLELYYTGVRIHHSKWNMRRVPNKWNTSELGFCGLFNSYIFHALDMRSNIANEVLRYVYKWLVTGALIVIMVTITLRWESRLHTEFIRLFSLFECHFRYGSVYQRGALIRIEVHARVWLLYFIRDMPKQRKSPWNYLR